MSQYCAFEETDLGNGKARYTCTQCGFQMGPMSRGLSAARKICNGHPETEEERAARQARQKEIRVGDLAEKLLRQCGLTKERYATAKAWLLRLPPEDLAGCSGCDRRQKWLNETGIRFQRFLRGEG